MNNKIENEIKKVQRRVPLWITKTYQKNSIILNTFMNLSNNNEVPIPISTLEKYSNLSEKVFKRNYNQMKTISAKNHGKVFEEENGNVILWKPVSDYIVNLYNKGSKSEF